MLDVTFRIHCQSAYVSDLIGREMTAAKVMHISKNVQTTYAQYLSGLCTKLVACTNLAIDLTIVF